MLDEGGSEGKSHLLITRLVNDFRLRSFVETKKRRDDR